MRGRRKRQHGTVDRLNGRESHRLPGPSAQPIVMRTSGAPAMAGGAAGSRDRAVRRIAIGASAAAPAKI